ncbi:hypothetical protein FDF26_11380 [Clostridium botulinum]|uniref:hypothetical protein n=1 Tax=unclassified Clostridium TaxID=2614128 RepID=UPI0013F87E9D|nr:MULTISPECIES: hypothetical protein [unclassified Clostridium]NFR85814.1 hypothetical protein [Clostridium botulinum]NFR91448.1 hypothetical protein [Clostridium botulinum]NFT07657.1 hypothetical protein [Clostridium botulinum]NFU00129.1 hypothetical protein [Clostridium botulinum]
MKNKLRGICLLISCFLIISVFASCESKEITSNELSTVKLDVTKMTANDIIGELKSAGFPINKVIITTAENDVNKLLGRPNQYTSKINFSDSRLEQYDEDNNPVGGTIEVFDNKEDAKSRKDYVETIEKKVSAFSQYIYLYKNILVRLDHDLTPDQAKVYENAFNKLQNGEKATYNE